MRIALIAGARPNFMKVAPVHEALRRRAGLTPEIVHTGQHYDEALSGSFFEQLGMPPPVVNFGVGSGSQARQVADVMVAFEAWAERERPGLVVVVGDVNSTLACGLVAAKSRIPLAHVEAGLRSFDRAMPEEINRVVVDSISDFLFVSEPSGVTNLEREGVAASRIHLVGNVMIDSLMRHRAAAEDSDILARLKLASGQAIVVTLHRPSNVDDPRHLEAILRRLGDLAKEAPVVLPLHPRTRARAHAAGIESLLGAEGLVLTEPLGYLDFLHLMAHARAVLTDSGGIQEETTVLGVSCLTLRDNTERPITLEQGTNRLIGSDPEAILPAWRELVASPPSRRNAPDLWDGGAAERIADVVETWARSAPGSG